MRTLLAALALVLVYAVVAGGGSARAQEESPDCPAPTALGELTDVLNISGAWSTDQCDRSKFLDNRSGPVFSFSLAEESEVRIDLSSPDRDALLYLLAEDGRLIEADDDTGGGNDARIERELAAGTYQLEVSALGWSGREGGSFDLSIRVVEGCLDLVHLGVLVDTLSATGAWSHFGCESDYRSDRAGQRYRFELANNRRIRIDLTSELADAYVYLLSESGALLEADDDGGVGRNSRIERFLGAGTYMVEATNWGDRDLKGLIAAEFELTIDTAGDGPIVKLEAIDAPDRVVRGLPFTINYRVGNLGDEPLSTLDPDARVRVQVRWPYIADWRTSWIDVLDGDAELLPVGTSYHSDETVQAFASQPLTQLHPFEGLFTWRTGPTDVMLEVVVINDDFDSLASHWLTRPIMVLTGFEFDPVNVNVDGVEYQVSAIAADDGEVETTVIPADQVGQETTDTADPTEEGSDDSEPGEDEGLDPEITALATYAAGVRTQVLGDFDSTLESLNAQAESLFSIVGRGGLPLSEVATPSAPTLEALLAILNAAHSETLVNARFDAQHLQSAEAAEEIVVLAGEAAARRIEQFTSDWATLLDADRVISPEEALDAQAQLAFAQHVDAPLVEAALLVLAKRDAESGWSNPEVAATLRAFAAGIDCRVDPGALSFSDGALRLQSPIYRLMLDRAYCGASTASDDHDLLLTGLDLDSNPVIPEPEVDVQPPAPPVVTATRLLARVLSDGRVEFAADLSNGARSLPIQRRLPVGALVDQWLRTGPVAHDGEELGRIYARRLSNGLVQATYVPDGADMDSTSRWVVPADAPVNAWLGSAELERGPSLRDDLVQRVADQAAGTGAAQFGDHLSLLALIENNLQRNP
ncbi:MAG: PPC domain-containing protein [Chloroflexi bacterium]|nr:PPC domain-containing protein [Chloroflexota bacterium]